MTWSRQFHTALYAIDGVGPVTHRKCLAALEEWGLGEADFWVNKYSLWQKINLNEKQILSIQKFKKEYTSSSYFESLKAKSVRVILPTDAGFPPLLKQTERFPPVLFVRGARLKGDEVFVAVVGTRQMSEYGRRVIEDFVPTLSQAGKTIVSGFMYGVDVAAQQTALKFGGKTVGVLGFGFGTMYPPRQKKLFDQFLEQGATFLSPFAPHVTAKPGNFPARNTVVAGMSEGVLVIEGAQDSGSLITAHYAADLGREVWAVPGSVYSRFSAGTQQLINEGAQLVNTPEGVLGFVSSRKQKGLVKHKRNWQKLSEIKRRICETLWEAPLTTDELGKKLMRSPTDVAVNLIELEMLNLVEQKGNRWQLK